MPGGEYELRVELLILARRARVNYTQPSACLFRSPLVTFDFLNLIDKPRRPFCIGEANENYPDVGGCSGASYSMWSLFSGLSVLILAQCAWGVLQIETDPYPIGWAALVFFDRWQLFRAGSSTQKRSGRSRGLCSGGVCFGRGDVGAVFGRGRGRGSLSPPNKHRRRSSLTNRRKARQGVRTGGSRRSCPAWPSGWIRKAYRVQACLGIGLSRDCGALCRQMGRAAAGRNTAMSSGLDGLLWRDKRGKALAIAIPRRQCDAMLARELTQLPRAAGTAISRAKPLAGGLPVHREYRLHSLAYNVGVGGQAGRRGAPVECPGISPADVRQSPGGIQAGNRVWRCCNCARGEDYALLHDRGGSA